jgi:hypothetical protein
LPHEVDIPSNTWCASVLEQTWVGEGSAPLSKLSRSLCQKVPVLVVLWTETKMGHVTEGFVTANKIRILAHASRLDGNEIKLPRHVAKLPPALPQDQVCEQLDT